MFKYTGNYYCRVSQRVSFAFIVGAARFNSSWRNRLIQNLSY